MVHNSDSEKDLVREMKRDMLPVYILSAVAFIGYALSIGVLYILFGEANFAKYHPGHVFFSVHFGITILAGVGGLWDLAFKGLNWESCFKVNPKRFHTTIVCLFLYLPFTAVIMWLVYKVAGKV